MAELNDADVDLWSRDWRRLRQQKRRERGGIEAAMLLDYLLYEGEHQSVQVQNAIMTRAFRHTRDKNKLRLVIPLARRLADKRVGNLWSISHRYRATPNTKDPVAFDYAEIVGDQLIPALDFKMQQGTLTWEIYKWMVICGVAFEHVDYKEGVTQEALPKTDEMGELVWKDTLTGAELPEAQVEQILQAGHIQPERFEPAMEIQETGDIGGDIYDPFRVFVDAGVTMVKRLGPDQRIYLADIRSKEWIVNEFGSKAIKGLTPPADCSILSTQLLDRGMPVSGLNLKDLLPTVQGSRDRDDPESYIVLTCYQPPSKQHPKGRRGFFVPDQKALDKDDNPFPEIPIVDYHWNAPAATMWTPGFMRDMQSLSKFINKRFSQLGEAANAQIYEMLLLGGSLTKTDIPTDFPGVVEGGINDDTGAPLVSVVPRGNLPPFFVDSIKMSMETLDTIGGSDITTQKKYPGQMRGSMALPMLQEVLATEDAPRFSHLGEQFSLEKMMRVNRVKAFYPPIRTLTYTGLDMRDEVLEFHADEVLRAGVDFTISVDPGTLQPELAAMREARIRERVQWAPGLYTNEDTGQMDWSKVAADLRYGDKAREGLEARGRKLARQLLQWARRGKLTVGQGQGKPDPKTGQVQPTPVLLLNEKPLPVAPYWPHTAMMDEYKNVMLTTEFLEASPQYQGVIKLLYDGSRNVLQQIQQAKQQSISSQMTQGAMAQASQQAAAKAASVAAEAAIEQVMEQSKLGTGNFEQLESQVKSLMGQAQGTGLRPESMVGGRVVRRRLLPAGQ